MTNMTLLMIDDDEKLVSLTGEYLEVHGFTFHSVHNGNEALEAVQRTDPRLVILDIMLPGKDGLEVCRELRRSSDVPILMLTARGDETDRIVGLELGADDYLAKPFNPRELLARIKAILRRSKEQEEREQPPERASGHRLAVGPIVLDKGARTVTVRGQPVDFTTAEFELLSLLLASAGRVLSRDLLMDELHGAEWESYDRSIDVHISRIRGKIEADSRRPVLVKTVRGIGYQFVKSAVDEQGEG